MEILKSSKSWFKIYRHLIPHPALASVNLCTTEISITGQNVT
ncbi:hypothetical protein [Caldithrix abyssi]|uniref:Uncharacterized protein n=1 Tax=Caldithrix abyssi DSM 13497 TaxID=880073 RepID=A0A1J1C6N2_CALAY|nr:hypothetical protein [Caldithrix abyssi]APF18303.1 hypothetical protein Cabys_1554 [Caldithrix abyssi DSM 13497]